MSIENKFKVKYIYKKVIELPVENSKFSFLKYNESEEKLYLLSEEVNTEIAQLNNVEIRRLYHISRSRVDKSKNTHSSIYGLLIPMIALFCSVINPGSNEFYIVVGISILIYTIYFAIITSRSECEQSYYNFYLEKFKYEADKRGIVL